MFSMPNIITKLALKSLYSVNSLRFMSISIDDFNKAKEKINTLKNDPGSENKLKLYALFKQATDGKCTKPKPGMMNFVDRAKWEAWTNLKDMNKEKAIETYVELVEQLCKSLGTINESPIEVSNTNHEVDGIDVSNKSGILTIRLNRIDKKNSLTMKMYNFWTETLHQADNDSSVRVVVITGNGDYFSSGNDLSNFTNLPPGMTPQQMVVRAKEVLQKFVGSFIDFRKPLIGLVNGPAIGITVTTLGLYDLVLASDKATFHTPFSKLGQTPEGCSSYIFPSLLGSKANDMLLFNRKLSATDALGLVTRVIPHSEFVTETEKIVTDIASLPPQTLKYSKELIRGPLRQKLHEINKIECDRLGERWLSDECIQALTGFFSKK